MSFWIGQEGKKITGSEEDSFTSVSRIIPDGTSARASIKKALYIDNASQGVENFYLIIYTLADGDFKGSEVQQKIRCFDAKPEKAARAKNMLLRLFKLTNVVLKHNDMPTDSDMAPMQNKIVGIKIREWQFNGKEGNWVPEVHANTPEFVSSTGKKLEASTEVPISSYADKTSKNQAVAGLDEDLPF